MAIQELSHNFDGSLSLVWADATNGQGFPNAAAIMARVTQGISTPSSVKQVSSPTDIAAACPQNFNLFSECFAAIAFNSLPSAGQSEIPVNYTISADAGLYHIDVVKHKSDYEKRILPLQWALDKVFIYVVEMCSFFLMVLRLLLNLGLAFRCRHPWNCLLTRKLTRSRTPTPG